MNSTAKLRIRQELIGNELMGVCCSYRDQVRVIIDELVSHLDDNQLDEIEDLIVNNYDEDFNAKETTEGVIDGTDYNKCVDYLLESMNQS